MRINEYPLNRTKNPQTTNVGIFSAHMVSGHNDLENIRVYWFPTKESQDSAGLDA